MLTKQNFLASYELAIRARYAWTADAAKLERFMGAVRRSLDDAPGEHFAWDQALSLEVWTLLGGRRKAFTLKALRALPEGDAA